MKARLRRIALLIMMLATTLAVVVYLGDNMETKITTEAPKILKMMGYDSIAKVGELELWYSRIEYVAYKDTTQDTVYIVVARGGILTVQPK